MIFFYFATLIYMQLAPLTMPPLPFINTAFLVNVPVLVIILVLFFIVYTIISSLLMYHWTAYGMYSGAVMFTMLLFLFVSVGLFSTAVLGIGYF